MFPNRPLRPVRVDLQVRWTQCLHLLMLHLWHLVSVGGIADQQPTVSQQALAERLNLPAGKLIRPDVVDPEDGALLDPPLGVSRHEGPDVGCGVQIKPESQPLCHRVFSGSGHVQLLTLCDRHRQLDFHFCLDLAKHASDAPRPHGGSM